MLSHESAVPLFLDELMRAHTKLLDAIEELDRLCRGMPPPEEDLIEARLKVGRASLAKRLLWGRILAHLAPAVRGGDEADLRLVQEEDIRLLKASVKHVAAWKPADAIANWRIYAAAESHLLQDMLRLMALEKKLLYPLLKRMEFESA